MATFTLRQLRYFDALAKAGHFGLAADACAISQPALSMQIRELEGHLGGRLFERGARHVQPTPLGAALLPHVRDVLQGVDAIRDLSRTMQGGALDQLRLGIIPTIAPYLLPAIIGNLTGENPALDLQIRETVTQKLIGELIDGRLDAAIVALPVSEPALQEIALFQEDFVLVRSVQDAENPVPSRENLRAFRLLLLEEGHCFRDQALSFCSQASIAPRELLEGSSLSTLVQMVGAGIGITLIPEMAIAIETRSAPVAIARFAGEQPSRTIGMVWRKTSGLADQLRGIATIVQETARMARNAAGDQGLRR
jgi:LysR family transcriptional regulator, hydrogen peroxide-inducible genes activator